MKTLSNSSDRGELKPLASEDLPQAVSFLSADVIGNLILLGFLKTGLSPQMSDRTYYGLWKNGKLEGVGLLGDLVTWAGGAEVAELLGDTALTSGGCNSKLLVGPEDEVEVFRRASRDSRSGTIETHLLYVLRRGELNVRSEGLVRLARASRENWEELVRVQTALYLELTGRALAEGRSPGDRVLRQIESGKTWIASEEGRIIFKADVSSEIDEAVLLEGIWTRPDLRGRGIGTTLLSELSSHLLSIYPMICLSFGKHQLRLKGFYERIGFKYHGEYELVRY
jgi:hypothetical protein